MGRQPKVNDTTTVEMPRALSLRIKRLKRRGDRSQADVIRKALDAYEASLDNRARHPEPAEAVPALS